MTDADSPHQHLLFSRHRAHESAGTSSWASGLKGITDPEVADRKSGNSVTHRNPLTVAEPAGAETLVTMTLAGKDAIARMRADANVAAGHLFDFAANMEKAVAFDPKTEERVV